jgi:hypothetical protein
MMVSLSPKHVIKPNFFADHGVVHLVLNSATDKMPSIEIRERSFRFSPLIYLHSSF